MDLHAEDFHHPYSPYDIQLQFMRALYTCLEGAKVGVFESPTGKSPSGFLLRNSPVLGPDMGLVGTVSVFLILPWQTAKLYCDFVNSISQCPSLRSGTHN